MAGVPSSAAFFESSCIEVWWPETGSNRRRRPFQGLLPKTLTDLESADIIEKKRLLSMRVQDSVGSFGIA